VLVRTSHGLACRDNLKLHEKQRRIGDAVAVAVRIQQAQHIARGAAVHALHQLGPRHGPGPVRGLFLLRLSFQLLTPQLACNHDGCERRGNQ
jgi:hypothetical protein